MRQHELTIEEAKCYCCDSLDVVGRASMNIWGTVTDFFVCAEHAYLDGRWADSIPNFRSEEADHA